MKIVVYENREPEYVPDILFEDGTYKNAEDYIKGRHQMDKRLKIGPLYSKDATPAEKKKRSPSDGV
jgi:hypothetical protein